MFYANEHPPPHFPAQFAEHRAVIDIESSSMSDGYLPVVKRRGVLAWAATRTHLLHRAFARATAHEKVGPIP